jgi:hypothetical protein
MAKQTQTTAINANSSISRNWPRRVGRVRVIAILPLLGLAYDPVDVIL